MTTTTARQDTADLIDSTYAWRRLLASLALSTIGGVGLWSVVVALPTIEAEFGVDRGGASLPYTATLIGFAIGGIVIGRLVDRFGIRSLVVASTLMLAIGYLAASQATSLWQFVLAQSLLIGMLGSSATFGPLVADVSLWFKKRRGIAIGVVASGNYLAGTLWSPVLQYAIETVGWRQAHMGIALVCVLTMLPLSFALRRRSPVHGPAASAGGDSLIHSLRLSPSALQALLVLAGIACCIAMAMPQVHIVAYCGDLGYGPARGAEMLSLMLGLGVVSRLVSGFIADYIGGVGTLILARPCSALPCCSICRSTDWSRSTWSQPCSDCRRAASCRATRSLCAITSRRAKRPSRVSLVLMATVAGMAIGGWMSGEIYDLTGSYQAAFLNGIAWNLLNMSIAAWLLLGRLRGRPATA